MEKINVYKVASKVGKGVKKVGGYALAAGVTFMVTKGPDIIKKVRKL